MELEQETIIKIQMMEQEINNLNEHLQIIEQNNGYMNGLVDTINEIDKNETKEIMVDLGKRIFIPVEIKERKLFLDVGKGNFVKKSLKETKDIIDAEKMKLIDSKNEIIRRLNQLNEEMENMIKEIENKK